MSAAAEEEHMGAFQTLEEARAYFAGDRFAAVNGMALDELTEDGAICSVTLGDDHRNAMGRVMGGVIFTLADFAFAVAANRDHSPTVALDANVHFMRDTAGSRLRAAAVRVKRGRSTSVYEIRVTDDLGKLVALVVSTGYKMT